MPRNFTDKSLWNPANPDLNNVNVALLGVVNSFFANLGATSAPAYGSQDDNGKHVVFSEAELTATSSLYVSATLQALYGGIYQVVKIDTGATAANIGPGLACFIKDVGTTSADGASVYSVTTADQATSVQQMIGVFLVAATPGNYTVVQVHGKCPVQYIATVTATTAGGTIILSGTAGKFDCPTQSGSPTFAQMGTILGNAISTPANGAIGTVLMRTLQGRY